MKNDHNSKSNDVKVDEEPTGWFSSLWNRVKSVCQTIVNFVRYSPIVGPALSVAEIAVSAGLIVARPWLFPIAFTFMIAGAPVTLGLPFFLGMGFSILFGVIRYLRDNDDNEMFSLCSKPRSFMH